MKPVLFLSYSHEDEELKDQLLQQLRVLEPEGLIEIWIDDRIPAGTKWIEAINEAMLQADIAILLITSNFLTSQFILENEVPALLRRRRAGGLSLFPIIGLPCAWQEISWLTELNVRPKNGDPVWSMGRLAAEKHLAEIAREISKSLKKTEIVKPKVRSAVQILESKFQEAISLPGPINQTHIISTISEAINLGAPIYDYGDIEGCIEIYNHTARRLLTQLRKASPESDGENVVMIGKGFAEMPLKRSMSDQAMTMGLMYSGKPKDLDMSELLYATKHDLRETLEITERIRNLDLSHTAWELRFCFDRILSSLEGFEKIVSLTASFDSQSEDELRGNMRKAIFQISSSSKMIYATGAPNSLPDKRSIISCSAFLLVVTRLFLKLFTSELKLSFKSPVEQFLYSMLDQINAEYNEVNQSNAYSIAWRTLQAFDWYLMPSD